jgi:SAM-dependent methyltransferase
MNEHTHINREYYSRLTEGKADYWRYMPAPRYRAGVITGTLARAHPASVLDLGCGDGSLLMEIRAVLPDAVLAGIDLAEPQIEVNRREMPGIEWYAANLEDDRFQLPHTFDAVTASELIEHLDDPERFLRAIRRAAKPGALLVISTQSGTVGQTERWVGHVRHFERRDLDGLLRRSGWEPERVWNTGFPFHDLSKRIANMAPGASMQRFGERRYGPLERLACSMLGILFRLNSRSRGAQLFAVARKAAG